MLFIINAFTKSKQNFQTSKECYNAYFHKISKPYTSSNDPLTQAQLHIYTASTQKKKKKNRYEFHNKIAMYIKYCKMYAEQRN